nr:gag pol polyprotein [Hymenolepis microstoma]
MSRSIRRENRSVKRGCSAAEWIESGLESRQGSTHIRTTAYHPEANGLVERFHRQLKSTIIATSSSSNWVERLPIILLSIRSTVKKDLGCCPAELVLGTTIRLPGEMFTHSRDRTLPDPSSYSSRLKEHFRSIHPAPTRSNDRHTHVHKDLSSCSFVFVRLDTVKKPLQPPYDGPYKVLQRQPKYFILDRNGIEDSSFPTPAPAARAHLPRPPTQTPEFTVPLPSLPPLPSSAEDASTPSAPTLVPPHPEPYYTRSGRSVTFPSRLADYVHSLTFEHFLLPFICPQTL